MNCRVKAEEFFEAMVQIRKTLVEIPTNCSQGETGALLYLTFMHNKVTASELSEVLQVSLPRTVSLLKSLETKQLIKRSVDKDDKRKTIVYITENGKKLVLEKKEEAIDNMAKIMEKLDEKDIDQYIKLTQKIGKVIVEMHD